MDPNLSPCSGRSPNRSPPRQRSSPKHRRAQSPQRSPKKACQASFEVRKENEKISNPPSREGSVAHSPIKKNSRSKSPEPSNSSLESFGRTLEVPFLTPSSCYMRCGFLFLFLACSVNRINGKCFKLRQDYDYD